MTQALTFIIQATNQDIANHLCRALETDARVRVSGVMRTAQQIYDEVARQRPAAVILTLGAQPQTTWTLCQHLNQVSPDTVVICAANQASPDLILDTLRNGAREFLRLPVKPEELHTVLERTAEFNHGRQHLTRPRGRVIAVFSSKGGCGTSFIAANLAVGLNAATALLDLNLQASSLDLFFGVKPRFSLVDFVENRARVDEEMLASLLVTYNDRLSLLAAPAKAEDAEEVRPEQVREAIAALRERFSYVVLDTPHTFDALTIQALDEADEILLVLGLDIVAVRAAQRALTLFQRMNYPREKIRLVLNRSNQQSEMDVREIERALGGRLTSSIPDDYRAAVASINLGQPLLLTQSASAIGQELIKLIMACGLPAIGQKTETRRGLLDTFLRRNTTPLSTAALPAPPPTQPLAPAPPAHDAPANRQGTSQLRSKSDESQILKSY